MQRSFHKTWNLMVTTACVPIAIWSDTDLHCGTVCLNSFGNRTSPSENSNNRWKRLFG